MVIDAYGRDDTTEICCFASTGTEVMPGSVEDVISGGVERGDDEVEKMREI